MEILKRDEDRKALGGTIIVAVLLFLLLFLMLVGNSQTPDEMAPGGVTISLGEPDQGGEDNSTAKQEEFVEQVEEEYTPENQLTSDVEEAPAVQETPPTNNTTKPNTTKPKETTTPKEEQKPNQRDLFGSSKSGGGSNGGTTGGDKGDKDGTPDGSPDGQGKGDSGEGIDLGGGMFGGIGGFKVAHKVTPRSGSQESGVVKLQVCVDASGRVLPHKIKVLRGTTGGSDLQNRSIEALKKFRFQNTSGSSGGCGYISFTFKLN